MFMSLPPKYNEEHRKRIEEYEKEYELENPPPKHEPLAIGYFFGFGSIIISMLTLTVYGIDGGFVEAIGGIIIGAIAYIIQYKNFQNYSIKQMKEMNKIEEELINESLNEQSYDLKEDEKDIASINLNFLKTNKSSNQNQHFDKNNNLTFEQYKIRIFRNLKVFFDIDVSKKENVYEFDDVLLEIFDQNLNTIIGSIVIVNAIYDGPFSKLIEKFEYKDILRSYNKTKTLIKEFNINPKTIPFNQPYLNQYVVGNYIEYIEDKIETAENFINNKETIKSIIEKHKQSKKMRETKKR